MTQEDKLDKAVTDLARVEVSLESVQKTLADQTKALSDIQQTLALAKGGWRLLLLLGGSAATLGAIATWVMNHVQFK